MVIPALPELAVPRGPGRVDVPEKSQIEVHDQCIVSVQFKDRLQQRFDSFIRSLG
jgi:hypothetical protein